jgi:Hydrazine synthase alpha subunit middle domain
MIFVQSRDHQETSMNKVVTGSLWTSSVLLAGVLAGCGSGSSSGDSATVTVAGDVPIAYAQRANTISQNPTNGGPSAPGGDLMIREKSSASALEHNITAQFTQGVGDVQSPDVSYDGKKIIFSMRCPTSNTAMIGAVKACTGAWNIWEYDMTAGGLTGGTFRRLTATGADDVEPTYLPAGRGYVFTSNRQTKSSVNQFNGHSYKALDEYEREVVFNLHTMDADGGNVTQISFNQSHDRSPTVRQNGDIMYSRWDHVGGRNHFKIFRAKPDGTDLFVLYGAHSDGNSFLHPRDMDPKGKYAGFLASDLMPLSGTHEGGGLVFIDAANFSEQNTPATPGVTGEGQHQATAQLLNLGKGVSQYGRISTPYPLWDGTDRVLLSFTPCEVTRVGVGVVSCSTLTADEMGRLGMEDRLVEDIQKDSLQDNVKPSYAIYMFDPNQQTFLIVAAPPPGFMNTHPVAIQSRTEPNATEPTNVDPTLAAANLGLLEVRSVYDTDGLGRMSDSVLTAADMPAGCTSAIAKTAPTDPLDTRSQVADLAKMKNPADAAYGCAPARFIRAVRAVAPTSGMTGMRSAIGETEFEMQQILGYAPIEPDGSFKLTIPADTPIGLAVVNAKGQAFQTHTNWIQVRPGERRTCDGCHSPRRGAALNSGAVVNSMPTGAKATLQAAHQSGETMASTRTRLDPTALKLVNDLMYSDYWADTTQAGVTARPTIALKYTGNAVASDDLVGIPAPVNGIINYPTHIAPLWTRDRGANTCTGCHNDPDKLDLSAALGGAGRSTSYQEIMLGDPQLDPNTGLPETRVEEGVLVIVRGPALVDTAASEGEALGLARKSRLFEIMTGQTLMSSADAQAAHPNPPSSAPDHSKMLNAAELRVLGEFMDLGGKYFNDPFDPAAQVNTIHGLSEDTFATNVLPILTTTCAASCHQAIGSSMSKTPIGTSFRNNRFVLTGDEKGDYGVTLTMISNACNAASNYLLSKPSTVPHPPGAVNKDGSPVTTPVLPVGSANYNTIASWIATGC